MIASVLTEQRGLIVLNMSTLQERMEELEADGWTVGKIAATDATTTKARRARAFLRLFTHEPSGDECAKSSLLIFFD